MITRYLSLRFFLFSLCLALFTWSSCTVDDDAGGNDLQVKDLDISTLENRAVGTELGQVIASAEGAELVFEVIDSEPADAFTIEASTGILKVAEVALFDFEERASLSAVIRVSAGSESLNANVLVRLEDEQADITSYNQLTKKWSADKFSYNGIFAGMGNHECRLDDEMTISGTGMYIYDGGSDLCGEEDNQQLKTGTWDLDENLNFILFDKGEPAELKVDIDFFEPGKISLSCSWMGSSVSGEYLSQ